MTTTFASIIRLWPSTDALALELSELGEPVTGAAVKKWASRDSIPAEFWVLLVTAARKRRFKMVTLQTLADLAHSRRVRDKGDRPESQVA